MIRRLVRVDSVEVGPAKPSECGECPWISGHWCDFYRDRLRPINGLLEGLDYDDHKRLAECIDSDAMEVTT